MPNTVDKLLSVARAEIGYCEKKTNSKLDSKTDNAGKNNYTKYWRDLQPTYQGQAWCDCFVDWCFWKAYGSGNAQILECGGFGAYYTPASAQYYKTKGQWSNIPKVGSQIFFKNSSRIHHTGIVESFTDTTVTTIEGNTSNGTAVVPNGGMVCRKTYKRNNTSIAGYGHPKFDADKINKTPTENTNNQTKVETANYYNKSIAGTYTTTSNLNLRRGSNTSKTIITTIPKGKSVRCYGYYNLTSGTKWYLVKYMSFTGFVSSKYLKK